MWNGDTAWERQAALGLAVKNPRTLSSEDKRIWVTILDMQTLVGEGRKYSLLLGDCAKRDKHLSPKQGGWSNRPL